MVGVVSVNNRQFDIGKVEHSDVHVIYDATKVNRKAPTGCEVKYVEGYKPDMIGEAQIETRLPTSVSIFTLRYRILFIRIKAVSVLLRTMSMASSTSSRPYMVMKISRL